MSREIVILRHAQAEPNAGTQRDFDRTLSPRGREEAMAVAKWFDEHGVRFDRVVSSPATRARETAELAAPGTSVEFDPAVYDATPGTLLAVLDRHAGGGRTLLVGHNPGLEQLVALLTEGRSDECRGLPTAGVARLAIADDASVEPGAAQLRAFWSP